MADRKMLPPLAPRPPLAHAHEADPAPPGHNLLTSDQAQVLRGSIQRIRRIQREIDALNREKTGVYDVLREAGLDAALARKIVYRLGLTVDQVKTLEERDLTLAAYWGAVQDLREAPEDEG